MPKVEIIESEKGWGSKVDQVIDCSTIEEAKDFIKQYNSKNTDDTAPDWYMYARLKE